MRWRRGLGRNSPLSRWRGSERQQGRRAPDQVHDRLHQRRFLPDPSRGYGRELPEGVNSVLEIVINGVDTNTIASAMKTGIDAACREGVVAISAGNYGGKLGPHHFYLRKIMSGATE